jgi:hypothetical protein
VLETFYHIGETGQVFYKADGTNNYKDDLRWGGPWKPSIHMPRLASRITLEVTGRRCERLQDISNEDAKAEGIDPLFSKDEIMARPELANCHGKWSNYLWHGNHGKYGRGNGKSDAWPYQFSGYYNARDSYSSLWELINGKGSWGANLYVWVIEFKRATP